MTQFDEVLAVAEALSLLGVVWFLWVWTDFDDAKLKQHSHYQLEKNERSIVFVFYFPNLCQILEELEVAIQHFAVHVIAQLIV